MDKHSLLDKPVFSPRANVRFNPTDNINLRASYSFGFREMCIRDRNESVHRQQIHTDSTDTKQRKHEEEQLPFHAEF